jgi:hypothetical protein
MAGGIFLNYPFELNPKCIIFSIVIIGLFFYEPPNMKDYLKLITAFVLFVISYVSMAWYDYKFECQKLALKKSTSSLGITSKFKPPVYSETQLDKSKMTKDEKKLEWALINIYHLLFLAPLFLYVGLHKDSSKPFTTVLLIVNFVFAIIYHGVRVSRKFNVISSTHVIMSAAGIYLLNKKNKPEWFYNTLFGLGIYTGLKHGMYLTQTFH